MEIIDSKDIVAAIIVRDDEVLICQRAEDTSFPLKWEFPGGKVEDGEEPREALQRELVEELAIDADIGDEILAYDFTYPNGVTVDLQFYLVKNFVPDPMNLEFNAIAWVSIEDLDAYDFLEGDRSIINYLQFSDIDIF
ncbi:MAG: NUDIX domain-containing protein [Candidatus Marinimicrobia bacterium]|nr:NUDIX domain-containing protein [Candidatus Neomarinimicrobiota bacterium]